LFGNVFVFSQGRSHANPCEAWHTAVPRSGYCISAHILLLPCGMKYPSQIWNQKFSLHLQVCYFLLMAKLKMQYMRNKLYKMQYRHNILFNNTILPMWFAILYWHLL